MSPTVQEASGAERPPLALSQAFTADKDADLNEPLAIVGMACRLPGADGLNAFWDLVMEGRAAWGPLPESRLDRELYFSAEKGKIGKTYSEMGAVVSDRPVDRAVCPLTADMAERYDIAHHIFLEVASLACRDAGLDPFAMPTDRRTGVYVGHTGGSTRIGDIVYATGIDETAALLGEVDVARAVLGDAVDHVAAEMTDAVRRRYPGRQPGREIDLNAIGAAKIVQEALRLDGPFLVVDAACASSLQAMAIATRALAQGVIDQAIVGGASYCKSDSLVLFSAAQSVSNAGSCPFGEAADGLITAEGYVALVIKTLSRAMADGDRIRAVIRGLGVSSDGKGKSLWAPRQEGQVLAVQRAYPDAADLGRIEYIEAHATSTQVGDATELAALSRLLRPHVPAHRKIPIGSVKANIGHTLETAGIASLVKVVLAMEHGMIPPGSQCAELNSEFDWQSGPFTVPREVLSWPAHADGSPRLAAVNAFGIGGLNVHVALSEYVPTVRSTPAIRPAADTGAIAIVGAGCVLPGALSLDAFRARVRGGESAIGPVPEDRWQAVRALDRSRARTWHTLCDRGGFVRDFAYDWRRHKVPPKQIAAANPLQFMLLEAADAALLDAGGPQAGLDRTRTAVVVGTLFGGDFSNQLQMGLRLPETGRELRAALARQGVDDAEAARIVQAYEKKVLAKMPALVDETGSFTSSTLASRLTKTFDLMGGALALDAGDCSSISALAAAADMLREGVCDAVLCAAGQRSLDLIAFEGLSLLGKLRASSAQSPDSFVPGEGAVVFVLKRLDDAVAAGNRIRGVIRSAEVRPTLRTEPPVLPTLTSLFGHTGAAAAAAELLAALDAGGRGSISISDGNLSARIDLGAESGIPSRAASASPRAAAAPRSAVEPVPTAARAPSAPTPVQRPLVAALFPGQGSQYTDMFRELATESPAARDVLSRLDATARAAGHETLANIAWRPDNGLGTRIWDTQWAMYLGDLFAWEMLRGMGFAPDIVASHSFGEFPALAAVGAWSVADGARATWARADAVEAHGPCDGAMLSVIADIATVRAAMEPFRGQVWVCAENSNEQFVIGGTARVVDAVEVLLESRRIRSKRLAVPSPFHTPLLGRAAGQLAMTIEVLPITAPELVTYSSTLARQLTSPQDVRESLIRQMTETVRWIEVIEELYAAGVRTFVEVGPSGVLTGLTRRILEGREAVSFLQFDQRGRAASEHLARLRAQLQQAGAIRCEGPSPGVPAVTPATKRNRGWLVSFDATARRRERNRKAAEQRPATVVAAAGQATGSMGRTTPQVAHTATTGVASGGHRHSGNGDMSGRRGETSAWLYDDREQAGSDRLAAVLHEKPAAASEHRNAGPDSTSMDDGVETFLIDFVVEQTGYPREIVELDADLEADLGIDSIRKAQLFGEIGQRYGLTADDGVSLDEFPTLRHLLRYLLPRVTPAAPSIRTTSRHTATGPDSHGFGASESRTSATPAPVAAINAPENPTLETFLIDFVVEQTGYPREIVELDADLESDLGIDSIRKAQLFGEIGQRYDLTADDTVSLDAFPTLRHLLDYMLPRVGGTGRTLVSPDVPLVSAAARPARGPTPDPGTPLDEFQLLVVTSVSPGSCGIAACFGRHATPNVRHSRHEGLAATCVTSAGASAAVAGWNAAGLLASASPARGLPVSQVASVEPLIMTCRSLDDARRHVAENTRAAAGLLVLHVAGGGFRVTQDGKIEPLPEELTACDPRSPLACVALADGMVPPRTALVSLLDANDATARDAMSATCAWFACGVVDGRPRVTSGGPVAGAWLSDDETLTGSISLPAVESTSTARQTEAANTADITQRYALGLRDIGPTRKARSLVRERVLIMGPATGTAALVQAVAAAGGEAIVADCGSAREAVAAVEQADESGAVRHLIVAASEHGGTWVARRKAGIIAPFFACQRWMMLRTKAGDIASSTLTAVVDLGGDLGLSGGIDAVEGGALAGLLKGIAREFPPLHVRVVDTGSLAPAAAASTVIAEVLDGSGPIEVAVGHGRRSTVVPEHRRPRTVAPLAALQRGSVWVVTGGARGVTAECARELGRRHGLVLALVGSTKPVAIDPAWPSLDEGGLKALKHRVMLDARSRKADPRTAWRTVEKSIEIEASLARFRAAGVDARYLACDLSDGTAVHGLVQHITRELGPVRGILHGAGYEAACRFEKKTLEGLESTLGPKCVGLEHLLNAVNGGSLQAVIGFGSTSGRLGGHGQADYSLANDMLAKIIAGLGHRRPGLRGTVFHWHAWDEVGMASRPESRFVLEQFGLKFMPLAEGVRRFIDEVEAGLPDAEVLVTEPACVPDAVTPAAASRRPVADAFVTDVAWSAKTMRCFVDLDPTRDRFLLDHRQHGKPILPAVMAVQLLFEAVKASGADADLHELRRFEVQRPLAFPTDSSRRLGITVSRLGADTFTAEAACTVTNARGINADSQRVHFTGQLVRGHVPADVPAFAPPPFPYYPTVYPQNSPLWHGDSFRTLTGLLLDRSGGWGTLVAPDPATVVAPRSAAGLSVPTALIDGCLMACGVYSFVMCGQRLEIPRGFDRLRLWSPPAAGEACTIRLRFREQDATETGYDFVLYGADGRPLAAIDGLRLAIMT